MCFPAPTNKTFGRWLLSYFRLFREIWKKKIARRNCLRADFDGKLGCFDFKSGESFHCIFVKDLPTIALSFRLPSQKNVKQMATNDAKLRHDGKKRKKEKPHKQLLIELHLK